MNIVFRFIEPCFSSDLNAAGAKRRLEANLVEKEFEFKSFLAMKITTQNAP